MYYLFFYIQLKFLYQVQFQCQDNTFKLLVTNIEETDKLMRLL